jgi:hypothetical protein
VRPGHAAQKFNQINIKFGHKTRYGSAETDVWDDVASAQEQLEAVDGKVMWGCQKREDTMCDGDERWRSTRWL